MTLEIDEMKPLLKLIVRAVEKGVGEDIRDYILSTGKATNNAIRLMRADNINTNLRDSVASDTVELKYFNRSAWIGCLLIDRVHKVTITICAKQTLEGIPRKTDRRIPHYLQSILHVQNANVEPQYKQQTLGDYLPEIQSQFSDEDYRADYQNIMDDDLEFGDDYKHLVVVYEASHYEVTSIAVKMLTPEFQTAQEYALDDLLKPDFSELTNNEPEEQKKDAHSLVSVKADLRKEKEPAATQETRIKAKEMEGEKQV